MKNLFLVLGAFLMLTFGVTSCQNDLSENPTETVSETRTTFNDPNASSIANADNCVLTKTLIAGQNIDAGTVQVWNDNTNLYVKYTVTGDWYIKETHVYAGDCNSIPLTKKGNPKIGQFPYNMEFTSPYPTTYTQSIALAALEDCFCIIAHAAIAKMNDDGTEVGETAFADGDKEFSGNRWGTYFEHCKKDCTPDQPATCETAFAGPVIGVDGRCFLDDGFSRWGWMFSNWTRSSIENRSYVYPIFAGAAKCDNSADRLVGYVSLDYDNTTDEILFTIQANSGFSFDEAHIFVGPSTSLTGQADYPVNSAGSPTVAPGQYGNTFENLGGSTNETLRVSLANIPADERFVFIIHTVVCGDFK